MNLGNERGKVAIRQIDFASYPQRPPFDPEEAYAEFDSTGVAEPNPVYAAVRNALYDLGLDSARFGTRDWNPFVRFIQPGFRVVIKPNLVVEAMNQDAVTTHASVIRPLVDYAWKAMRGDGEIVICDAPVIFADFQAVVIKNGLRDMVSLLKERGVPISLRDLRARRVVTRNNVVVAAADDPDNARDAVTIDLKEQSHFEHGSVRHGRLAYGAYGRDPVRRNHARGLHLYRVARTILEADAIISVPKLKTHKKAGITCCLKNLVGINVDKDYLPHYTSGPANCGGDEFPQLPAWRLPLLLVFKAARRILLGCLGGVVARPIARLAGSLNRINSKKDENDPEGNADTAQKVYRLVTGTDYGGSWSGNETIWRMILDLNRIFLFADAEGNLAAEKRRNAFYLVDGFISGVGNGPLTPHIAKTGIVVAGHNAAMVDKAILEMAGIDAGKIPLYREAFARQNAWLHESLTCQIKLNGKNMDGRTIEPIITLVGPYNWHYAKDMRQK